MKLIRQKSDAIILYFFDDAANVEVTAEAMRGDIVALDIKSATHEMLTGIEPPPYPPLGGALSYASGVWAVSNAELYAEHEQKQNALKVAKAQAAKAKEIYDQYDAAIAPLEAACSKKERETWPQQVTEARAYQADETASTPLIDAMLLSRPDDTKAVLVGKINANYSAYSGFVGAALGVMQTRTAALNAIDLDAPDAVDQIAAV
jgi:hypothetical protein